MRIDIPTEGIEELIASLGFDDARNVLTGRAMGALQHGIDSLMEQYAERREARQCGRIVGSPASANNQSRPSELPPPACPGLNYFAPKRNLQDLLAMEWFDKVSTDKKRFTVEWRNQLIEDLMKSEYRDKIAEAWSKKDMRLQVKGRIMGALSAAGALKKSALAIARIYYGTGANNTKEVKTLAKYMGDSRKEYYTDWIVDYVKSQQPIEK